MSQRHAEADEAYPGTPSSAGNCSDVDEPDPALQIFVEVTLNKVLTGDETASSDSSRPPLMEDYQYETYIFKLLKLDRPSIRETFDSWANETYIVKLMKLDRQLIRETFDSWATTFRAIDDSA